MIRWLRAHGFILGIYATFVICLTFYIHRSITFQDVESWPWVPALIVDAGGELASVPFYSRSGSNMTTIDTRFVEFTYSVNGKLFRGNRVSPDGRGFPANPSAPGSRAYYKPSAPEIAVLIPTPFEGTGLLFAIVLLGLLIITHLWFTVPDF